MSREPTWLLEYKRNVYTEEGEDGIIEKILEVIPQNDKWCVEFGAWDGLFSTNTRNLIESKDFSAVLIEADKNKFSDLLRNYSQRSNVITINKYVGFSEDDNLDQILSTTPIPHDFDLLSIDIDGNDYHVWKAISKYRPKVVVIEFNPTIPTEVKFIQPADPSVNQGTSLLPLVELGKEKEYELVSVLSCNAFFVRKEYYPLFQIESNTPEVLRTDLNLITYLFSGYDGRVFLHGSCQLPWHVIDLKESEVQFLPKFLRKFRGNYSILQQIAYELYLENSEELLNIVEGAGVDFELVDKFMGEKEKRFWKELLFTKKLRLTDPRNLIKEIQKRFSLLIKEPQMTDTPVTIQIHKEEVLAQDVSRVRRELDSFVPVQFEKNRNAVTIFVTGYEKNKLKLFLIPEVRTWFHRLFEIVPDLFYWMDMRYGRLILYTLMRGTPVRVEGGAMIRSKDMQDFLMWGFTRLNAFCNTHGFDPMPSSQHIISCIKELAETQQPIPTDTSALWRSHS